MTKKEKIKYVSRLAAAYKRNEKFNENLEKLLGLAPESPLLEHSDKLIDELLDMTALATSVDTESLLWFVYDNRCGKNKFPCWDVQERKTIVNNVRSFIEFETTAAGAVAEEESK